MKKLIKHLVCLLLLCSQVFTGTAQTHTLSLSIKNQPETQIKLGWIKGDDCITIDSTYAQNGHAQFKIQDTAHTGIYRVTLGKTTYARVMNEGPQQIDFIFNNESIVAETNFKNPIEELVIIRSEENKLWYDFKNKAKAYKQDFSLLEKELNNYWDRNDTSMALTRANDFNRLQMEWDLRLSQTIQQNNKLFASKIMAISRQPVSDGFLSAEERNKMLKTEFFKNVKLSNEELIYSSAYTDKVFEYLMLFNAPTFTQKQRTAAYISAVDAVMKQIGENGKVKNFISSYLIHGFEVLKMPELIQHIKENY